MLKHFVSSSLWFNLWSSASWLPARVPGILYKITSYVYGNLELKYECSLLDSFFFKYIFIFHQLFEDPFNKLGYVHSFSWALLSRKEEIFHQNALTKNQDFTGLTHIPCFCLIKLSGSFLPLSLGQGCPLSEEQNPFKAIYINGDWKGHKKRCLLKLKVWISGTFLSSINWCFNFNSPHVFEAPYICRFHEIQ